MFVVSGVRKHSQLGLCLIGLCVWALKQEALPRTSCAAPGSCLERPRTTHSNFRTSVLDGDSSALECPLLTGICVWPGTWLSPWSPQPRAGGLFFLLAPAALPDCILTGAFHRSDFKSPFWCTKHFLLPTAPSPWLTTALGGKQPYSEVKRCAFPHTAHG